MFRNYCKTAIRNLLRSRTFSIINLTGLSLSVAFCLLLFFYIRHEQSYDKFHANADRLFRIERTSLWSDEPVEKKKSIFSFLDSKVSDADNDIILSLIVGRDLKSTFPDVKEIIRFKSSEQLIRAGNSVYKEGRIVYADQSFLKNFSFPLLKGNINTVLTTPQNVVISASIAKKYFADKDPIGKKIEFISDSTKVYTVEGVVKDAPENSSIDYSLILPLQADDDYETNIKERFNHSSHLLFVELNKGASPASFEQKINNWAKTYFSDYFAYFKNVNTSRFHLYLRPLADCHYNVAAPWGHYTNSKNIYELACFVFIIILIAALNYILLTVSNLMSRTKEVGVRKVMGAKRRSVILQFWVETQILVIISVIIGTLLAVLLIPVFNRLMNTSLNLSFFSIGEITIALLTLAFILGLLAGYYPAMLISKLKPVAIVKSFQTFRIKPRFSRILVVIQYTGCVILMIAAFVMYRQMQYISNKDLGFDKEQVLIVKNPTYDSDFTKKVKERLHNFANTQPYISMYSGMNGGLDGAGSSNGFQLDGEQKWRKQLAVDFDYFELLGLKFVQGRPFSRNITSDTSRQIRPTVVNETLFKILGKTAKLGEYNEPLGETIIGVVKDYNFESLSKQIGPEDHVLGLRYTSFFLFKIKPGKIKEAISKIGKEWKDVADNYPFEYTFLDESIARMYEPEMRWQTIIRASCFFAIFIACMGLFGLSAINAANRIKEVGIRKVLGAEVKDIVKTLSSSFLIMIAISIAIATPVAWWIMNNWLEDFAYRIQLSWWMFAGTGVIALLIALGAVSYHAIKAARANPVKSLRTE
jgi:putative ABC transport system permease protein